MLQPFHVECCDYIGDFVLLKKCVTEVKEYEQRFADPVYTAFMKKKSQKSTLHLD